MARKPTDPAQASEPQARKKPVGASAAPAEKAGTASPAEQREDALRLSRKPVPLAQYVAVLRREIARAAAMSDPDDDLPMVAIAEAELSFSYVVVAVEGEQIYLDASGKALAEAPAAAVQRMRLRMVDADMAVAMHEKG